MDELKDYRIKQLLKNSVASTSDDFTEKLMQEINAQALIVKNRKLALIPIYLLCGIIFVLSLTVNITGFTYLGYTLKFSPLVIFIICSVFLILEVQKLYELRKLLSAVE